MIQQHNKILKYFFLAKKYQDILFDSFFLFAVRSQIQCWLIMKQRNNKQERVTTYSLWIMNRFLEKGILKYFLEVF